MLHTPMVPALRDGNAWQLHVILGHMQACAGGVHARGARPGDAHARGRAGARGGAEQPGLARLQVMSPALIWHCGGGTLHHGLL